MKITVLGDGAWGTALAHIIAYNNYPVTLCCYNKTVADSIRITQENKLYMPGIKLNNLITPITDINKAVDKSTWIFEAIPILYLRSTLSLINRSYLTPKTTWVILSKGMEKNTLLLADQILDTVLDFKAKKVILSGPSFASELIRYQLTCVDIASDDYLQAQQLQKIIHTYFFNTHYTPDLIGVQIGGALKNVITLAIGIFKSQNYSDNTISLALTKGLQEIALIAQALGGHPETIFGLSGMGDLILTALGSHSKNLRAGTLLGHGKNLEEINHIMGNLPEGINTAASAYAITNKYVLNTPFIESIYKSIYNNQPPSILIKKLLTF